MQKGCPLRWKRRRPRGSCTASFVAWSTVAKQGVCNIIRLFALLVPTLTGTFAGISETEMVFLYLVLRGSTALLSANSGKQKRPEGRLEDHQSCLRDFADHFCDQQSHLHGGSGGTSSQCLAAKRLGGKHGEGPGNRVQ